MHRVIALKVETLFARSEATAIDIGLTGASSILSCLVVLPRLEVFSGQRSIRIPTY